MKRVRPEPRYDVASALSPGHREYQEDSLIADFPLGTDAGFAVLADGMGGHAAGDTASKIIVTEVYSELKFQSTNIAEIEKDLPSILWAVTQSANECIRAHVAQSPRDRGMGSTLIAPIFVGDHLYWISIGDSPLYLIREGEMRQINADHSMAPEIDERYRKGEIDEETARTHPDRNCLTSVLCGGDIPKVDCPKTPFQVEREDIYLVSSDGLQFLDNEKIAAIVAENREEPSSAIAAALLNAITELDDPDQDNVSFAVIKVNWTDAEAPAPKLVLTKAQLEVLYG